LENLKQRARALKKEIFAIYLAAKDSRMPWYAKAVAFITIACALSPIDLIPDFIPVFGYLDDLVIVPAGIALTIRLIPAEVLAEARATAATQNVERSASVGYVGLGLVLLIWILAIIWSASIILKIVTKT
jgi:uncharacterized membrane protein YkvA (DUF1232 family)